MNVTRTVGAGRGRPASMGCKATPAAKRYAFLFFFFRPVFGSMFR